MNYLTKLFAIKYLKYKMFEIKIWNEISKQTRKLNRRLIFILYIFYFI